MTNFSEVAALGLGSGGAGGFALGVGGGGSMEGIGGGLRGGNGLLGRKRPIGGMGGNANQNILLGRQMAAAMGWRGDQWDALRTLWMNESGWRTDADNPTSSAYGIPQAMLSLHDVPADFRTNPRSQIRWGLNYIKGRYGNPRNALNFWNRNRSYAIGEWNIRDDADARVHKGEMIIPSKIASILREELSAPGIRDNLGRKGGGSGVQVTFAAGAITVQFSGAGEITKRKAETAGRWVVDAMMEDARFKALAEG